MKHVKQLSEMNCIESLEALREGLRAISDAGHLPEISLIELFINRAIECHKEEVKKEYERGVDSILLSPDYSGTIGGPSDY